MRHHLRRPPALLALLAATAVMVIPQAIPALAAAAGRGPAAGAAAARPAAGRGLLLINGDRLVAAPAPGGGQSVSLAAVPGSGAVFSLKLGGLSQQIPVAALPYLGHGLDPSLFSVRSLRRAEADGRLPVRVSFAGRRPALPGVRITRWAPGAADGYLTSASARVFGTALERQFRADHRRASYGSDGLFAGGVSIALPGAVAPPRPHFVMHPLRVTASDLQGRADNGDAVLVINADDVRKFGDGYENYNFFYHGSARYSVPAGHYWAIGDFLNFAGTSSSERLVVLPQFTVRGSRTSVHVDERAATSEVTMTTPRPAVPQMVSLSLVRRDLHGTPVSVSFADFGLSLWVSPTTVKPTVGTLRSYTSAELTSPPKAAGIPYAYNLDYAGPDGIIPPQHYLVSPGSLATVSENYYQDVRSTGLWSTLGGFPDQLQGLIFGLLLPLRLPGQQVQYLTAGPSVAWASSYIEFAGSFTGGQNGSFRSFQGGQQLTEDWNRYPLHPQPYAQLLHGALAEVLPQFPSAFRTGNTLVLSPNPFSDNQQGHYGAGFFAAKGVRVTGTYAVYQNGARIARGNAATAGIAPVRLSARPSVLRLVLNAARRGRSYPLSPASTTVWTWRSAADPAARVPRSWLCGFIVTGQQVRLLRRCAVQPQLTLAYQVQGLALDGTTAAGQQRIGLSVGHLQLARSAPITGASARVSYNDGRTWNPASVSPAGSGSFQISFTAPAGVDVTLRVGAADAAGGAITETIVRAYGVRH